MKDAAADLTPARRHLLKAAMRAAYRKGFKQARREAFRRGLADGEGRLNEMITRAGGGER